MENFMASQEKLFTFFRVLAPIISSKTRPDFPKMENVYNNLYITRISIE